MTSFGARCLVFTSKGLPQYIPPSASYVFSQSQEAGDEL